MLYGTHACSTLCVYLYNKLHQFITVLVCILACCRDTYAPEGVVVLHALPAL